MQTPLQRTGADMQRIGNRLDGGTPAGEFLLYGYANTLNEIFVSALLFQLFLKLRRAGLVESARGRLGGYRLSRPASAISVAEIMAAVEEDIRMTRCGGEAAKPCMPGQRCLTHGLWDALGEQIAAFLESVTLQEVIDGIPVAKQAMRAGRQAVAPPLGLASE